MAKVKLSLTIDPEVVKAAKHKAIEKGTSVSAEVERYLRKWIEEDSPKKERESE